MTKETIEQEWVAIDKLNPDVREMHSLIFRLMDERAEMREALGNLILEIGIANKYASSVYDRNPWINKTLKHLKQKALSALGDAPPDPRPEHVKKAQNDAIDEAVLDKFFNQSKPTNAATEEEG